MKNKSTYGLIAFTVVLCWALWNYSVSLELLDKFYKIILPFLIGGFIAFIVNVLMTKLEVVWDKFFSKGPLDKLEKVKRVACLIWSIALIAAFFAFTVLLVLPELNSSVKTLIKLIPPAVEKMNVYLQEKATQFNMFEDDFLYLQKQWNNAYETIFKFIQDNKSLLLSRTWIATTTVVDVVTNFAIGIVAAVYLLLEKDVLARSLKRTIYAFTTKERADYLVKAGKISQRVFHGYVAGQFSEALILGCMCFAGMFIIGLPYALVISVLVAVLGLIPILGTIISAAVGCFLILVAAPEKIWVFLVFFIVLQRIEGDILYPKIVGKAVGLSELWVLVAVTIGGSVAGIIGMVMSVPLCSVIYTLLSEKVEEQLEEKNMGDIE